MMLLIGRRNSNGFTLIELVIIVFLIGIITAITTPRWMRTLNYWKFQTKVNDFVSFIRYVRERAIIDKRDYKVIIFSDSKGYTIINGDSEHQEGVFARFLKSAVFPDGTTINASKNEINFNSNGEIEETDISFTSKNGVKIQVKVMGYGRIKVK